MKRLRKIFHFAERADTSGFFPQLAKWHDRDRWSMCFGTLCEMEPSLAARMTELGVSTFSLGCGGRATYPAGIVRLAAFLRRERFDVVHTHLFDPSIVGLLASRLAGTPTRVMTRHYSDYHTRIDRPWHVRLDQMCTALSHAVIAVSRHTADHMTEREAAPARKIRTVLNGIDFSRVEATSGDARARVRAELSAGDAVVLLVMARLHPEKGQSDLFRALPELRRATSKKWMLWVAGAGTFEAEYRAEVAALGCEDVVRFLGFRRDAADVMTAADVVVLPSVAEAFGLVVAEAIYLGKPVVATRVGGIPEIVEDGVDGVLVPPADPRSLAAALAPLIDDADRRERIGGAGIARVRRQFSFETMIKDYEAIYEALASASGAMERDVDRVGDHHLA